MAGAWAAGSALTKSLADSVTPTDSSIRQVTRASSDALTPSDFATFAPVRKPSDSLTMSDAVAKAPRRAASDALVVADSEQQFGDLAEVVGVVKGDTATVADASRVTYTLRVADSTAAVDNSPTPTTAGARSASIDDSGVLIETVTTTAGFSLSFTDSVTLSDVDVERTSGLNLVPAAPGVLTLTPLE